MPTGVANVTGSSDASGVLANVTSYYRRQFIEVYQPNLLFAQLGDMWSLERRSGMTITGKYYDNFSAATAALQEGVAPAPQKLSATTVVMTLYQRGAWSSISDIAEWTHEDEVFNVLMDKFAKQVPETIDTTTRDYLVDSGTSVRYSNGAATTAVNTIPDDSDFDYVENLFETNDAKPFTPLYMGSVNEGTKPQLPAFIAVIHPNVKKDARGLTDFDDVQDYAAGQEIMPGEIGQRGAIKFLMSNNAPRSLGGGASGGSGVRETSSSADVYKTLVFAEGAFAKSKPEFGHIDPIIIPPEKAGHDNPLQQYGTCGWKCLDGTVIQNDNRMCRVEHAASTI